eukprot:CAMPEP_0194031024 /NCGR_PEP_ID=MMETSP0009_2-20130614/4305_1 /TAXON_ID=210454 /ORGANISM="Grammatophora oceanica, Strain CCMP 410" /LENGTH=632 /DNA_ID=CAMNT_0038671077 /DNA_START=103 /DNA_END=2001 /DNA_ORIENTATION=+
MPLMILLTVLLTLLSMNRCSFAKADRNLRIRDIDNHDESLTRVKGQKSSHRQLQQLPNGWEEQPWWSKWRQKILKRGLKKCAWLDAFPASGDSCNPQLYDYKCMFGVDWECEGDSEPAWICDCDVDTLEFTCYNNTIPNPCDPEDTREPPLSEPLCPDKAPVEEYEVCDYYLGENYDCNYTEIDCCGQTIYANRYTCDHGHWRLLYDNPTCAETGFCEGQAADMSGGVQSMSPTASPTTEAPTASPSISTTAPTETPITGSPTGSPTATPTKTVETGSPTVSPTSAPTDVPSASPSTPLPIETEETNGPTVIPTSSPTAPPTNSPTARPSNAPTSVTTSLPTIEPTDEPTSASTDSPTTEPTTPPTSSPLDVAADLMAPPPLLMTLIPLQDSPTGTPSSDPQTLAPVEPMEMDTAADLIPPIPLLFTVAPSVPTTSMPTASPTELPPGSTVAPTLDTTCPLVQPEDGEDSICPINPGQAPYFCHYDGAACPCTDSREAAEKISCSCNEARGWWVCFTTVHCDDSCLCPDTVRDGDACSFSNDMHLNCPSGRDRTCFGETGSEQVCNCWNGEFSCTDRFPTECGAVGLAGRSQGVEFWGQVEDRPPREEEDTTQTRPPETRPVRSSFPAGRRG